MTISLSNDQVRLLRLHAQHLTMQPPGAITNVAHIVREMCGIQAQEAPAAALAIRVRGTGLTAADVEQARVQERTIVRTWGQRGTLHLLATEDLGWLLQLFGPIFIAGDRRRREELGLDEDTCIRAIRILRDVLANHGPMTRAEIVEQLATHGIHLEGQARPHLLGRAALEGVICFGPDRGTEPTYVLLNDWINGQRTEHPLSEDQSYIELTRRYLNAYGPATPKDMAAWSGLPMNKIRTAWQRITDQLIELDIADSPAWMFKTQTSWLDEQPTSTPIVRLLPRFDIYLLGYHKRDFSVPPEHAKRVNAGGGILHPTVLVDGRTVGIWKSKQQKKHLDIIIEPFDQLAPEVYPGLEAEVADLARFIGMQAAFQVIEPS